MLQGTSLSQGGLLILILRLPSPAASAALTRPEYDVETRATPRRGGDKQGQACSLCSARTALLGRTRAQRLAICGH
eukprot:scaffold106113_cov69-Phaeocystis_antarctica.AAC.1